MSSQSGQEKARHMVLWYYIHKVYGGGSMLAVHRGGNKCLSGLSPVRQNELCSALSNYGVRRTISENIQ